jgi:zinc/manganese transport system permease protein
VPPVALDVGFQSNWVDVLQAPFVRDAFLGGSLVALAAGLVGWFVIVRSSTFAAHALAHIGFPGATAAVLVGAPVSLGLAVFCVGGALAIGLLGERLSTRDVATGTILAFATGLGILFSSLAAAGSSTVTNVLFGNLLAISSDQLLTFLAVTVGVAALLAAVGRPLALASVSPRVAEARGVPVTALGVVFLVVLALVIAMAVQVVGTLLLFALVVTPAATALAITARPALVMVLSTAIALLAVWLGLLVAVMFNLPPSFVIVSIAVLAWLVTRAVTRERGRIRAAAEPAAAPASTLSPDAAPDPR